MKSNPKTSDDHDIEIQAGDKNENTAVMHPLLWKILLLVGLFNYSSYTIFAHLCEKNGKMPFKSASLILVIEMTKFALSFGLYIFENRKSIKASVTLNVPGFWIIIPFSVPAILYCINNNLAIFIQLEMDPATYQVLSNFKILTTAILFRLIMQKHLSKIQWGALGLLLIAGILNSYGGLSEKSGNSKMGKSSLIHISFTGLIMISVYCSISGFCGVYTEYVMKKQKELSIHLQNGLLYTFGMILNGTLFLVQAQKSNDYGLFTGFTLYAWLLVLTQAVGGLIMGAIMKFASNITRLFLISTAMVTTTIFSMLIFGLQPNLYIIGSIAMVSTSLYLYHM